jgi:LacI family transcriptional regulator
MNKQPTAYDVAKLAGVSQTTVSFVFNKRDEMGIGNETRVKVLDAALKLGYQPNRLARALSIGKTNTIALWTYGVYDHYYSQAVWMFRDILRRDGYEVQMVETDDLIDEYAMWLNSELWPVDGIIAFESPKCVDAYIQASPDGHKPIVSAGSYCSMNSDYVGVDLLSGTLDAVNHLIACGHSRILWVGIADDLAVGQARYDGYVAAMDEAGLKKEFLCVQISHPSEYRRPTYDAVGPYIEKNGCPDAIFCVTDEMTIAILRRLRDMEIRVPEDISLIGCDGIPETDYHEPRLSTVATPIEQMCDLSWEFLRKRIENPGIDRQHVVLKPTLIIRESSDYQRQAFP